MKEERHVQSLDKLIKFVPPEYQTTSLGDLLRIF